MRILIAAFISLTLAGHARAQKLECAVEGISINTGVKGNLVLPTGTVDPNWTVIADPDPLTTEPRPAGTIPHLSGVWSPAQAASTWISSYPTEENDLDGTYSYQYCFCLADRFDQPQLFVSLLADDWAEVFLNNQSLGATVSSGWVTPKTLQTTSPSHFRPGRNCIRVDVHNDGGQYSGFNLIGNVSAAPNALQRPECCNKTGSIQGRKFEDANGNGAPDSGEPGLGGWTITLSNGQTVVTDAYGYYSFMNLAPGSYTLSETQQSGWQQTAPSGGKHSVTVTAGSVAAGKDFGNRRGETPTDGPCSLCGQINAACCLGKNDQGQKIYSFTAPITYQSFSNPPTPCQLAVTAPPGVTIVSFGPAVALPGTTTFVSGTFTVTGTPPKPFCIKVRCAGGKESCESAVCIRELPECDR